MNDKRQNLRHHIKAARDWLLQAEKSIECENDVQGDLKLMLAKAELKNAEKHRPQNHISKILSLATAACIAFAVFFAKDLNTSSSEETTEQNIQSSISTVALSDLDNENVSDSSVSNEPKSHLAANSEWIFSKNRNSYIGDLQNIILQPSSSNTPNTQTVDNDVNNITKHTSSTAEPVSNNQESESVSRAAVESNYDVNVNESKSNSNKVNQSHQSNKSEYNTLETSNGNKPDTVDTTSTLPVEQNITSEAKTPSQNMQKLMQSAGQILRAE
ncbi:MAG: hypothetical protein IJ563_04435 [Selenomonadaceae bacterium]|nr:hypothetical protein [Selenomonadaceae bacterium]MBR1858542.1 hypothetical protein [Selenomonadaceae bacterium]